MERQTQGRTDTRTGGRTDAGDDNIPWAIWLMGKIASFYYGSGMKIVPMLAQQSPATNNVGYCQFKRSRYEVLCERPHSFKNRIVKKEILRTDIRGDGPWQTIPIAHIRRDVLFF